MFELKKISKSFKDGVKKKNIFNDCSFKFPEKGMVFIIGKSGCGKSTLLNLLAGFDVPDDGNITFLGQDINELNGGESVAYYQHEIGFIFQDYNLIDSLSVYENISLAANVDKASVKKTVFNSLKKVGMNGFENRKISQLSGGQKQRVAIARALCSNVKVLLCDEPTGALDKENSIQVFECMKTISKNSLVIVVTHDLLFAKKYSDIILTIKEGKLVTYEKNFQDEISYNIKFDTSNFKRNIKVWKIGFSYVLCKKVRFLIAILLMTISLSAFGLSSSLVLFNKTNSVLNHMEDNDLNYLSYHKALDYEIDGHIFSQNIGFDENDIANLQKYSLSNVLPKYSYFEQKIVNINQNNSSLYSNVINGFCEINKQIITDFDFELFGTLPSNDNEVVITDYIYQVFKKDGYRTPFYERYDINEYNDIIGKEIQLSAYEDFDEYDIFKIVGILDTKFNDDLFKEKDTETTGVSDELNDQMRKYFNTSLEQTIFLKEGYYKRNIKTYNDSHYLENNGITVNNNVINYLNNFNVLSYASPNSENVIYKNGSLDNIGIVLPLVSFETTETHCLNLYITYYAESVFSTIETAFKNDFGEESTYQTYSSYLIINDYQDSKYLNISKNDLTKWCINKFIEDHSLFETNNYSIRINANNSNTLVNLELQGITFGESKKAVYLSTKNYNKLVDKLSYYRNDISMCYIPLSDNKMANKDLFEFNGLIVANQPEYILDTNYRVNKAYYEVDNLSTFIYDNIDDGIAFYKSLLLVIGGALFVFSIFFIFFDVKGIISTKEKEIGILKSLGINSKSIIGSFVVYSIIFTLATSILSNLSCIVISNVINNIIQEKYCCNLNYINYSYIQGVIGFILTFCFSSVISFFSIIKTYRKKTIDLIK